MGGMDIFWYYTILHWMNEMRKPFHLELNCLNYYSQCATRYYFACCGNTFFEAVFPSTVLSCSPLLYPPRTPTRSLVWLILKPRCLISLSSVLSVLSQNWILRPLKRKLVISTILTALENIRLTQHPGIKVSSSLWYFLRSFATSSVQWIGQRSRGVQYFELGGIFTLGLKQEDQLYLTIILWNRGE